MEMVAPLEVAVRVVDLEAMARFYTDGLGCTEEFRVSVPASICGPLGMDDADVTIAFLKTLQGERIKLIASPTSPQPGVQWTVAGRQGLAYVSFYVRQIDDVADAIETAGGRALSEPRAGVPGTYPRFGYFADPEGNVIELIDSGAGATTAEDAEKAVANAG
jgi:catechol 2,3-dioxygenase-like lactoylglutathione lyase family enzyme